MWKIFNQHQATANWL